MRIFIGLTDIANIITNYADGFRLLGHETFTAVWNRSHFYPDSQYDLVIDKGSKAIAGQSNRWLQAFTWFALVMRTIRCVWALKCDVFIFFAPALLPIQYIYPFLKYLGKDIVTAFWGSDIRYWYAYELEMKSLGVYDDVKPFINYLHENPGPGYFDKLRNVQISERYSSLILSQPGYGQLQRRPYIRAQVPINLSTCDFQFHGREIPLIIHAPSIRGVKGTEYVIDAVNKLKAEGVKFEFELIEKMPNHKLRKLLSNADIVIDQLFAETVATLTLESMACGNAVLSRYMADYSGIPNDCPVVNVSKDTLKSQLKRLINDHDFRKRLAYAGRIYTEIHHDHIRVVQRILDWLDPQTQNEYDFVPTFFNQLNIPPKLLKYERRQRKQLRRRSVARYRNMFSTASK